MKNNFGIKINAKELRDIDKLNNIPSDKPGYYKWWARESDLKFILKNLGKEFEDMKAFFEYSDDGSYCIYIGIATKESLRSRLNWHINTNSTKSNIKNRTLSTLKQSISALVCRNMADDEKTNNFIDNLYVEYFLCNCEIKSEDALKQIKEIENSHLKNNDNLYILNIQENKHPQSCAKELKALRKIARLKGLDALN